ncbi:MAG: hypothetical protein M1531_07030 [Chloroflexi bacterium]|nr:hypothetical protein [Chloroflexota bacterium]
MDILSREELKTLAEYRADPCVSIYMPTHRAGTDTQEDPIRLKKLLRQAEADMMARGIRGTTARDLLRPAAELLEDPFFWQHQSTGLAVFASRQQFRHYSLPVEFEERVVVTDRFEVQPLFPLLTNDGLFYILALSQKMVKLFHCTRDSIRDITPESVPKSLAEALRYDQPGRELQFHTDTAPAAPIGERAERVYGQGVGEEYDKDRILRYTYIVDKGLHEPLRDQHAPLVLATVDYLLPIYKEANTYPLLVDEAVAGNPEAVNPSVLHDRAWNVVLPYLIQAQRDAYERYRNLIGSGRVANDIREVVPAAYYGRVDTLFTLKEAEQWGRFDPDTATVELHSGPEPGDEDLVNFSAIYSFVNKGTVFAVELADMPDSGLVAAILRY